MSASSLNEEKMRKDAEWMRQPADDRILEVLREEGNMTPRAVSRDGEVPRADVSRDYAGSRLRVLRNYGLVRRLDRGLYQITNQGIRYLDEKLDAATLEPADESN
jgi:hypothetical protein